jgi:DNA invertase Pin-like site-specific DNA recombinase
MIVFYARVSTTEQTTAHQRTQAEQAGFKIDKVVADEGISGVSTRLAERPEGKRLFDMLRAGDTLVVRWVDRLGRNYTDVVPSNVIPLMTVLMTIPRRMNSRIVSKLGLRPR